MGFVLKSNGKRVAVPGKGLSETVRRQFPGLREARYPLGGPPPALLVCSGATAKKLVVLLGRRAVECIVMRSVQSGQELGRLTYEPVAGRKSLIRYSAVFIARDRYSKATTVVRVRQALAPRGNRRHSHRRRHPRASHVLADDSATRSAELYISIVCGRGRGVSRPAGV